MDPRVLPTLKEDIMTDEDFDQLKDNIINEIVVKFKAINNKKKSLGKGQGSTTSKVSSTANAKSKKLSKAS